MIQEEQFEALKSKLDYISLMGQWYRHSNITTSANEAIKLINKIKEDLNEPCGMSRK
jgi:hypothetical protein